MTIPQDAATALTDRRGNRFGRLHEETLAHVESHGCDLQPLSLVELREVEVLTRATHSTYVLELAAGLGEATLHIASAFGRTGRLEAVESDQLHADHIEKLVRRYALEEIVARVHRAPVGSVLPALSGPYDLIVAHRGLADLPYEDLVRLLRTGGSLILRIPPEERVPGVAAVEGGLLQRLASDPRMAPWFAPGLDRVIATRIR